jgi:surface polysaccharide O-acyltransferase-like enzyme
MQSSKAIYNNGCIRGYNYITCLRWLATIGIVIWHVSGNFHHCSMAIYLPILMINESVKWSLPLFIMISGALLLNEEKKEDNLYFFKKRINKILIPLIFWVIFYTILKAVVEYKGAHTISGIKLINDIFLGRSYYHLWFLNLIMILYIFTPVIRKILYYQTPQRVKYAIFLFYSFAIIIYLLKFLFGFNLNLPVQVILFLPYFLSGYYFPNSGKSSGTLLSFLLFIFSVTIAASGSVILSLCSNSLDNLYFGGSFSITTVVATVTLFNIFYKQKDTLFFNNKKILLMKHYEHLTFGIYLVHPFFILTIRKIGLSDIYQPGSLQCATTCFWVLILSFIFCWSISLMPYIRRII